MSEQNINLLPKALFKSREQTRKVLDRTTIFSGVLPMVAVLVWIVFIILNYFVQFDIQKANGEIKTTDNEILNYQEDKDRKALLILKTRVLKDIIQRDVNPEKFFSVVLEIINSSNLDVNIDSFGRNTDGKFSITGNADNVASVTDLHRIFRNSKQISEVELLSTITKNDEGRSVFQISFNILD